MIRGEKVLLRTVRESDIETLFTLSSDLSLAGEFQSWQLRSEIDLRKKVQENGLLGDDHSMLLIIANEQIVGSIIFFKAQYYDGLEIGYLIYDPTRRNQGYATEALGLLCKFLFLTKKINRLQLGIIQGNLASRRVAEKCGFCLEGVLRGALFHRGKNRDLELFSLLRADLLPD
jgi:RimJ/RimL family protein N-acetyltransferase